MELCVLLEGPETVLFEHMRIYYVNDILALHWQPYTDNSYKSQKYNHNQLLFLHTYRSKSANLCMLKGPSDLAQHAILCYSNEKN